MIQDFINKHNINNKVAHISSIKSNPIVPYRSKPNMSVKTNSEKSNTKAAIITDFIIQFKPYLALFCVYSLRPHFSTIFINHSCDLKSEYPNNINNKVAHISSIKSNPIVPYRSKPNMRTNQKKILRIICVFFWLILLILACIEIFKPHTLSQNKAKYGLN